jgi:hypothetical protein
VRLASLVGLAALLTSSLARAEAPEAARVDVSLNAFTRTLQYNDDYFGFLRDFRATSTMVGARGEIFPGAFFTDNPLADIGLYFGLSRSFGLESTRSDGERFPTTYGTREVGLLVRHRIRKQTLGLRLGYGGHRFELDNSGPSRPDTTVTPDVPSVHYQFMRIGVESRLRVWQELRISPSFAYLPVFDSGGLESDVWFPRTQSGGLTTGLEVGYVFIGSVEIFLAFEYRRFFHDFNVQLGDPGFIAGGAVDNVYLTTIGVRYVFRRKTSDEPPGAKK